VPHVADAEFRQLTASQRKSPVALGASADSVLRALEAQEKRDA